MVIAHMLGISIQIISGTFVTYNVLQLQVLSGFLQIDMLYFLKCKYSSLYLIKTKFTAKIIDNITVTLFVNLCMVLCLLSSVSQ